MGFGKNIFCGKKYFCTGTRVLKTFEWIRPEGHKTDVVIYNPITKSKNELVLKTKNVAKWYMCGPTVYAPPHLGHACSYIRFDAIRQVLTNYFDVNVLLVMGMTDIDDKIIQHANAQEVYWQKLALNFEIEFLKDMYDLNVQRPTMICNVTKFIPQIIDFIKSIISKNMAYVASDGSVYFDTSKYDNYGKLKPPEVEKNEEQHLEKKSPLDFALWKSSKPTEPWWNSPWGNGRPGWHIECSAIASSVFGNSIDIHSGGQDLLFPHHENEEAQSCIYHDTNQWVNYWVHSGHLTISDGQKMSKSEKNSINIRTVLKNYTPNEFRMLCLRTHYRKNIEFSEEATIMACGVYRKIQFFLRECDDFLSGVNCINGVIDEITLLQSLETTKSEVRLALADDFNIPKAIQSILNLISIATKMMHQPCEPNESRSVLSLAAVSNYVQSFTNSLGFANKVQELEIERVRKIFDVLVDFRHEIRMKALNKNVNVQDLLKACDETRNSLSQFGLQINDKQHKSAWLIRN